MPQKKKWEDFELRLKHKDIDLLVSLPIPEAAKTLYWVLLTYRNINTKTAIVSKEKMAKKMGKSIRQVRYLLDKLVETGLVDIYTTKGKTPNKYKIRLPSEVKSMLQTMQ